MGGQQGKAQIQVNLNQASIVAGENITGSVNLILSTSITDLVVVFRLTGKEVCTFTQTDLKLDGKVKVLNYQSILYNSFGSIVKPGNYSLPFTIRTPQHIPGTFFLKSRKYDAKVVYHVSALIVEQLRTQANNQIGKHKVPILIKQCINSERYSLLNDNTILLRGCSCFARGESTIRAHLNKNAYLPGEIANIWVEVDNSRSRLTLKSITIRLFQVTWLFSNNNMTSTFKKRIFSNKTNVHLPRGDKLLSENALSVDIPLNFKKTSLDLCGTTEGKIVKCRFEIEITSSYGMFNSIGPGLDIPILIYPHAVNFTPSATAPEEWNPIEMPMAEMRFD